MANFATEKGDTGCSDIDKYLSQLVRQTERGRYTCTSIAQYSARDGISRVSFRSNINEVWGDEEGNKDDIYATNRQVDMMVPATTLVEGTDGALIV